MKLIEMNELDKSILNNYSIMLGMVVIQSFKGSAMYHLAAVKILKVRSDYRGKIYRPSLLDVVEAIDEELHLIRWENNHGMSKM